MEEIDCMFVLLFIVCIVVFHHLKRRWFVAKEEIVAFVRYIFDISKSGSRSSMLASK